MYVNIIVKDVDELINFGKRLGEKLRGSEVIELIGDVGAGKTTFVKGIADGLGIEGPINSPSFPILISHAAKDGKTLNHYDFYRLDDPGIMQSEISESLGSEGVVTVVEWGDSVAGVLPDDRIVIKINYLLTDNEREIIINKDLDIK